MSPLLTTDTARRSRPRLRLLRDECASHPHHRLHAMPQPWEGSSSASTNSTATSGHARVLVAGADPRARSKMLAQLRDLLPEGTPFVEAQETWEVVAQAAESRMVVLTGDLRDLTARGLVRVLSRRHPLLPVIALGECSDGSAAPQLGAASL